MASRGSSGAASDLKQMDKEMAESTKKRNLTGSLNQVKEELNEAYMNFQDLQNRCVIDIQTVNKTDKPVYYFKPDTFLLDSPEN